MLLDNIKQSWDKVNKRIDDFIKGEEKESFRLLFVTDVHIGGPNGYHIEQLRALKRLLPGSKIDFVVNGGDIGLDVGEDEKEAKRVISLTKEATDYGDMPYFFCKGNHDNKPNLLGRKGLSPYLNRFFLSKVDPKKGRIVLSDENEGGYGYYIDTKSDTKFIFLNTSENVRGFNVSKEQLRFVVNELMNASEKKIVIISHYCLNECGAWNRYPEVLNERMQALRRIEKDFASREKGEFDGLLWDFRNVSPQLVFHLSGDSHFNSESRSDGYLIASRQGYGGVDKEDLPLGASVDDFDKHEECDFDILVLTKNHAKLFRVGAGENEKDIDIL